MAQIKLAIQALCHEIKKQRVVDVTLQSDIKKRFDQRDQEANQMRIDATIRRLEKGVMVTLTRYEAADLAKHVRDLQKALDLKNETIP